MFKKQKQFLLLFCIVNLLVFVHSIIPFNHLIRIGKHGNLDDFRYQIGDKWAEIDACDSTCGAKTGYGRCLRYRDGDFSNDDCVGPVGSQAREPCLRTVGESFMQDGSGCDMQYYNIPPGIKLVFYGNENEKQCSKCKDCRHDWLDCAYESLESLSSDSSYILSGSTGQDKCSVEIQFRPGWQCTQCEPGKYSLGVIGLRRCIDCTVRKSDCAPYSFVSCDASKTDTNKCQMCMPGTDVKLVGGGGWETTCTPCLRGTYRARNYEGACQSCPTNKVQPSTGKESCYTCGSDQYIHNGNCVDCTGYSVCDGVNKNDCEAWQTFTHGTTVCGTCVSGSTVNPSDRRGCMVCSAGKAGHNGQCTYCEPGKFSNNYNQIQCTDCPPGKYTNTAGQTNCIACEHGKVSIANTQDLHTQCVACEGGEYLYENSCKKCKTGTYSTDNNVNICEYPDCGCESCPDFSDTGGQPGATECTEKICDFPPPTFFVSIYASADRDQSGSVVCKECLLGSAIAVEHYYVQHIGDSHGSRVQPKGIDSCTECNAGMVGRIDENNVPGCLSCAVNTYTEADGMTVCTGCVGGEVTGNTRCTLCSPGTYSKTNSAGVNVCTGCESGKYNTGSSNSECLWCPTGKYQDDTAASACKLCAFDTYNNAEGQTACTSCALGYYTGAEGSNSQQYCTTCESGEFLDSDRICKVCPQGTYSAILVKMACLKCPQNTYNENTGQSNCIPCERNKFAYPGATVCSDLPECPENSRITQTSSPIIPPNFDDFTMACQCNIGFGYSVDSECTACDAGFFQIAEPSDIGFVDRNPTAGDLCYFRCICGLTAWPSFCDENTVPDWKTRTPNAVLMILCDHCQQAGSFAITASTRVNKWDALIKYNQELECVACIAGTYQIGNECRECEIGEYQNEAGQTSCITCDTANGQVSKGKGATECSECNFGKIWNVGKSKCMVCEPGQYIDIENHKCQACSSVQENYCAIRKQTLAGIIEDDYDTYPEECNDMIKDIDRSMDGDIYYQCLYDSFTNETEICDHTNKQYYSSITQKCEQCDLPHFIYHNGCSLPLSCEPGRVFADFNGIFGCWCTYGYASTQNKCQLCEKGKYNSKRISNSDCDTCPFETTTEYEGTILASDCLFCGVNQYLDIITNECVECDSCSYVRDETHRNTTCKQCTYSEVVSDETFFANSNDPLQQQCAENCLLDHKFSNIQDLHDKLAAVINYEVDVTTPNQGLVDCKLGDTDTSISSDEFEETYPMNPLVGTKCPQLGEDVDVYYSDYCSNTLDPTVDTIITLNNADERIKYRDVIYYNTNYRDGLNNQENNVIRRCYEKDNDKHKIYLDVIALSNIELCTKVVDNTGGLRKCDERATTQSVKKLLYQITSKTPWFDFIRAWFDYYNVELYTKFVKEGVCATYLNERGATSSENKCNTLNRIDYMSNNPSRTDDLLDSGVKYRDVDKDYEFTDKVLIFSDKLYTKYDMISNDMDVHKYNKSLIFPAPCSSVLPEKVYVKIIIESNTAILLLDISLTPGVAGNNPYLSCDDDDSACNNITDGDRETYKTFTRIDNHVKFRLLDIHIPELGENIFDMHLMYADRQNTIVDDVSIVHEMCIDGDDLLCYSMGKTTVNLHNLLISNSHRYYMQCDVGDKLDIATIKTPIEFDLAREIIFSNNMCH